MESISKITSQLIKVFEDDYCIKVKFETNRQANITVANLHAYFILDSSASMTGSPIEEAKGALISFITKLEKLNIPITVISFNSTMSKASSKTEGYKALKTWVEAIEPEGWTLFKYVFQEMEKDFIMAHLVNTFVLFLSDGQDNEGLISLTPYMESFKSVITKNKFSSTIHTIGFSEEHDAKLLSTLTNYGTKVGTFQYVEKGGRIPVAVNNATEFLFQSLAWGQYIGGNGTVIRLEINDDENNPDLHHGIVYLNKKDIAEPKIEIYYQDQKYEYKLELQEISDLELEERIHLFTSLASNTALNLLIRRQEKQITKEELPSILKKLDAMDKYLAQLIDEIKKKRSLQKKQMMPFCLQSKDMIAQFYSMMKGDIEEEVSNIRLAQLNKLAYHNILQRSLLKKINKRIGLNAGMLQKIDEQINSVLKEMDFEKLGEEYKNDLETYGNCLITYKDWFDALQDGDSFCLTFHASRPPSGIMDPTMVSIKTINTSQLTAEAFLDSALFITRSGQIIKGEGQHGASAASLVKGLPDEIITGIMPLYINKDNWKIARLRMPPLLGWTVAQDVLAYEIRQLIILPFSILAKAAVDQSSEHKKMQFKLIFDTCMAIYNENKKLILSEIKAKLRNYIKSPESRLTDTISNSRVLLIHLYIASQAGDINVKDIVPIFPYVIEEELRRHSPKLNMNLNAFYMKVLNVDKEKYIMKYLATLKEQSEEEKVNKFKPLIEKGQAEEIKGTFTKKKVPAEEVKLEVDLGTLNVNAQKVLKVYNTLLTKPGTSITDTIKLLPLFGVEEYKQLKDMGINTPVKELAFIVQTATQNTNTLRRSAIKKGEYVSPFDEAASEAFILKLYKDVIVFERNSQKSKLLSKISDNINLRDTKKFAETDDLIEAARLLYGVQRGNNDFSDYFKVLMKPNCRLVLGKAKMLASGQFLGTRLIMDNMTSDKEKKDGFITWKPGKQNAYRIWSLYREQGTLDEWKEVFPHLQEYLEGQEKRRQGIFVPYRRPKPNVRDVRHYPNDKKKPKHTLK